MSSAEAGAPSTAGRQAGQGRSLRHAWHGPLALHCHLQVVRERLPARQHLIRHDLRPQLVQLTLVEGRRGGGGARGAAAGARGGALVSRTVLLREGLAVRTLQRGRTGAGGGQEGTGRRPAGGHGTGHVL